MIYFRIALAIVFFAVITVWVWKPYAVRTLRYVKRWAKCIRQMNQHIDW